MRFLTIILVCICSFLSAQTETKIHLGQINASGATDGQFAKWNVGTGKWEPVSGTLLPTGTTGQTLRYDGSGWVANSVLYNNGTNVGVGTTGPTTKLTVIDDTSTNGIQIYHSNLTQGVGMSYDKIFKTGSNANGDLSIDGKGTGHVLLQTDATGNVGIGVTNPVQRLDINGNIHMNANALIDLGTAWNTGVFKIQNGGTTVFAIDVPVGTSSIGGNPYFGVKALHGFMGGDGVVQYPTYGFTQEQGLGMYRPASGELGWVSGNLQKMRMNGLGYLGIGTTNPQAKLDVQAAGVVGGNVTGLIVAAQDTYTGGPALNSTVSLDFALRQETSTPYIYASIRAGEDLSQGAIQGSLRFFTQSYSGGPVLNEWMRITSTGRVGIGTNLPNRKFTVKGAIGIQDPAGASRVLLNAASWDSTYMSLQNATLSEAIANSAIWQSSIGATSVNTAAGTSLGLRVNNVAIANLTATGLGIGTAPSEALTVSGKAVVTGSSASPSTTITGRDALNTFGNVTVGTALSLSSGTLAVNTTTLDGLYAKLGGNATGAAVALGTTDAQNVSLGTNSTAGMIMNTSQRIGVKGSPVANVGLAVFDSTGVQGSSNSFATGYGVEGKKSAGSGAGVRGFATGPSGAFISGGDFDVDSTAFSNAILRLDDHGSVSGKWNIHGTSYWPSFLWGKLLVGPFTTTTNTAWVNLGGGSTATAPLRFTAGTNLTTPEAGAVEFDGTNYFATSGSTRYTLAKTLTATAALDFPSTASGVASDLSITVTGAALGDVVSIGVPNGSVTATATYTAWVSATNTVTVRFIPHATEDPASGTFRASVMKY